MALFQPKLWKNCATCNFWTGSRKTNDIHSGVRAEMNCCGECMQAKYKGLRRFATNSCLKWRRWNALAS